jgi:cyclic beta-1,2-glucan synthetase
LTRALDGGLAEESASHIYVQDLESDKIWQIGRSADSPTRVIFHAHVAEFHQRADELAIAMEVFVTPQDDVEIRRVSLVNNSDRPRRIAVTSYGEVVLARAKEHERHPAFSKMIVASEYLTSERGLLYSRRARRPQDRPPWLFHRLILDDAVLEKVAFDTDRRTFLGRHGNSARPLGLINGLAGTTGWTLDPVLVLQGCIRLESGARSQVSFVTIAAGSRGALLDTAMQFASNGSVDWALQEAQRAAAHEANELSLSQHDLALAQSLGSRLLLGESERQLRRPDIDSALDGQQFG